MGWMPSSRVLFDIKARLQAAGQQALFPTGAAIREGHAPDGVQSPA